MVSSTTCAPPRHLSWHDRSAAGWREWRRIALCVAFVLLCGWTAAWSDARLAAQRDRQARAAALIYLPPTPFLRAVALGYQHALADVLWFRTISYFGEHYRSDRLYPWLAAMCAAVTDLDPQAEHVYRFGGVLLPWEANRVDDGIALLEKGARNLPRSWQLRYMLGFSYYFFADDLAAASRTLRSATLLPGAPDYVMRLATIISAAHQGPDSVIEFLSELERSERGGVYNAALHQRIQQLVLSRDIDALEAAVRTFQERFNHLPTDLDELVAVRIVTTLPHEPFGGTYVLDSRTGHVRSSLGHEPLRLGSSPIREAFLKAQHAKE